MSNTLKLPYVRFVRQVSNGAARSKYSYQAMMADNFLALQKAEWRQATCRDNEVGLTVNAVAATDGVWDADTGLYTTPPTFTQYLRDRYDAFKQGGDANQDLATMCGYAGCVAYRFAVPQDGISATLNSVGLVVARDRFCLAGVRVAVVLSDDSEPSDDWTVVRGEGAGAIVTESSASTASNVASWGALNQSQVPYLRAGRADEETITLDVGAGNRNFVWVYLTLEDYADFWINYDATTPRHYSIEGSAQLVARCCTFTFGRSVAEDDASWTDMTYRLATAGGLSAPNLVSDGGTTADVAAFGNLLRMSTYSGIFVASAYKATSPASDAEVPMDLLSQFARAPRKNMFSAIFAAAQGAVEDGKTSVLPLDDLGVFASGRYAFTAVGDTLTLADDGDLGDGLASGSVGCRFAMASVAPVVTSAGVTHPHLLSFSSRAMVVPASGAQSYTRLRVEASGTIAVNMSAGLNIWLVRASSMLGPYACAALSGLMSHQELFSGAKGVTTTVDGDGSISASVTASASLVGYMLLPASDLDATVLLSEAVEPGDVLLLTVRPLSLVGGSYTATTVFTPTVSIA